jgi:hypothetical protein
MLDRRAGGQRVREHFVICRPGATGVDDEERDRLIEALKNLHATKVAQRIEKKKSLPALTDSAR